MGSTIIFNYKTVTLFVQKDIKIIKYSSAVVQQIDCLLRVIACLCIFLRVLYSYFVTEDDYGMSQNMSCA